MAVVYFITHPDVVIDPAVPVPQWRLSERGHARMQAALAQPRMAQVGAIYCSTEQKARDGAAIVAEALGVPCQTVIGLGQNDRSATGYLPGPEFDAVVDEFFRWPRRSVRGWERAADAQWRIVAAVDRVIETAPPGDLAIVSHGGVGTLLLCHLKGVPIHRGEEQPPTNGANYFAFDRETRRLLHGWLPID